MVKKQATIEEIYDAFALTELVSIGNGPDYTGFYKKNYLASNPALHILQENGLIRKAKPALSLSKRKYNFYSLTPKGRNFYDRTLKHFQRII